MNYEISIDNLNVYGVSVKTQRYIEIDGTKHYLNLTHRKAYSNSVYGRKELQKELAEPYYSAVMAVWGDEPTVFPEDDIGGIINE